MRQTVESPFYPLSIRTSKFSEHLSRRLRDWLFESSFERSLSFQRVCSTLSQRAQTSWVSSRQIEIHVSNGDLFVKDTASCPWHWRDWIFGALFRSRQFVFWTSWIDVPPPTNIYVRPFSIVSADQRDVSRSVLQALIKSYYLARENQSRGKRHEDQQWQGRPLDSNRRRQERSTTTIIPRSWADVSMTSNTERLSYGLPHDDRYLPSHVPSPKESLRERYHNGEQRSKSPIWTDQEMGGLLSNYKSVVEPP